MPSILSLRNLKLNEKIEGVGVIANPSIRESKAGKKYLDCVFTDKTGSIKAKMWDFGGSAPESGSVFEFMGTMDAFNGEPQVNLGFIRKCEKYDNADFLPSLTNEEFAFYKAKLEALVSEIKYAPLREFVSYLIYQQFPTEFMTLPGGKANHHACVGGLLQHSVNVCSLAVQMAKHYPEPYASKIHMDLLIAGGLIHDIGKCEEYCINGTALDRTLEGTLTTHYDTNNMYLYNAWEKTNRKLPREMLSCLMHYACTHHGPELSERPPGSINAWLIHAADLADSFIDTITHTLSQGVDERGMSIQFSKRLGAKVFDENILAPNSGQKSKQ